VSIGEKKGKKKRKKRKERELRRRPPLKITGGNNR